MRQKLNKLTTVFTRSDRSLYKVRQVLQNVTELLLQSATVITN